MSRTCVITGLGYVGAYGGGRSGLARALRSGECALSLAESPPAALGEDPPRQALLLRGPLDEWIDPRAARRLSPSSKFAVAAAWMALGDGQLAELEPNTTGDSPGGSESAVHIATALGPTSATEALLEQIFCEDPESASPLHFMESVANAPAAQVAIALGAHGPNSSVTQREAGGLLAVCGGSHHVAEGRCDRAVVGCVDELTPLTLAVFERYRSLAGPGEEEPIARPFDRDRDGFVMAEGAAVWLLEDERSARARGAPIKGRIVATVRASDPTASSIDWGRGGECLARALLSGLARQNIDPTSIDLWLSSASGSRTGDALEASVYRQVFSGSPPPLLAPKSIVGEYGGGFLAASLLAIEGTPFGPTRGFETPDPALGITPHMGEPLARPQRVILSSLGAGGAACWVVIDRA